MNKRIAKKLEKLYWGTYNAERLRKVKMRVFRKKNRLDRKAVEIAKKIHCAVRNCSLWEKYMSIDEFEFDGAEFCEMKCLLSAIRKAIIDNYPIENTYLHEIPYGDNQMLIVDFVNKDDYDDYHLHKKDVGIRGISFYCYYDRLFAQPVKDVDEGGSINSYEVDTCQEAESVSR